MEKTGQKKRKKTTYEQDLHLKLEKCDVMCDFALIPLKKKKWTLSGLQFIYDEI